MSPHTDPAPALPAPPLIAPVIAPAGAVARESLRAFLLGLSVQSAYRRFFTGLGRVPDRLLTVLTSADERRETFVASLGEAVVGHVMWSSSRLRRGAVEVAVVVGEGHRRTGLGRALVRHAVSAAADRGARSVEFSILRDNVPAIAMVLSTWPQCTPEIVDGVLEFSVPLQPAAA